MKNNPHQSLGAEFNKPTNEIAGVIEAYNFMVHNAAAGISRVLWPVVEAENQRQAAMRAEMVRNEQLFGSKPVNSSPIEAAVPSSSNVLGQAALQEHTAQPDANILEESDDPEVIAEQTRQTINRIHREVTQERAQQPINREDLGHAA